MQGLMSAGYLCAKLSTASADSLFSLTAIKVLTPVWLVSFIKLVPRAPVHLLVERNAKPLRGLVGMLDHQDGRGSPPERALQFHLPPPFFPSVFLLLFLFLDQVSHFKLNYSTFLSVPFASFMEEERGMSRILREK